MLALKTDKPLKLMPRWLPQLGRYYHELSQNPVDVLVALQMPKTAPLNPKRYEVVVVQLSRVRLREAPPESSFKCI